MEESIYKHNYEYLSIEEAKSIIGGTFIQGTTNIGGELATKADIDGLLKGADKKLTSIVPVTDTSNEFICFFECEDIETFPDDLEHRWIEVSPIQFTFPADGGSVKITGSYGLTGTLGTRKKVGDITDTITVDANATPSTKSGSKTYYYNNTTGTNPSATVTWTQDAHIESFTYEYHIYIGQTSNTIQQKFMQLVWQGDQYNQSSKKSVFVKAYKNKINESNQVVSTEQVEYGIKDTALTNQFTITDNKAGLIYCYPSKENSSYSDQNLGNFIVYVKESESVECKVNLIQDRKGVQIIYGDAVMFTYNWDKGEDLDQATFVNLNLSADKYDNYAGYYGIIIDEYKNILYFAGDNMGKGNEYAFIDFKNISKYLNEHRDDQSSIAGKTILQSLTDNNGAISIQCHLYTNWYRKKETENITLSYSVYNKDSEDATVKATNDKTFTLTGYTKIKDYSNQALCYACGTRNAKNSANVKDGYTLSAKFTYYLDSGVFAFDTNKNNVGKWHKGAVLSPVKCNPSYSNVQFTNDGKNINFSISIDSIGQPNYFDKNSRVYIKPRIQQKGGSLYNYTIIDSYETQINQLPYKIESSTPLADVIKNMNFDKSNTVIPRVLIECAANNYTEEKYTEINPIELEQNVLTIQK